MKRQISQQLIFSLQFVANVKTPFAGYEKYGVDFAFENSMTQKTATAHVTWPEDEVCLK